MHQTHKEPLKIQFLKVYVLKTLKDSLLVHLGEPLKVLDITHEFSSQNAEKS